MKRDYEAVLKEIEPLWSVPLAPPSASMRVAHIQPVAPMDPPDPIEAINSSWSSRGLPEET